MENGRLARNSRHGSDTYVSRSTLSSPFTRAECVSPHANPPAVPLMRTQLLVTHSGFFRALLRLLNVRAEYLLSRFSFSGCTPGRALVYLHRIACAQRRHRLRRHSRNSASTSHGRLISGVDLFGRASLPNNPITRFWKGCDHTCSSSVQTSWCSSTRSSAS